MPRATLMQAVVLAGLAVALAFLVISSADSWGDWVVFGVIVLTALGVGIAVNQRRYPARKRVVSRSSDDPR